MTDVFKCAYEVPADLAAVTGHFAAVEAAEAATWAYLETIGGLGFHSGNLGGHLYGVIFPDLVHRADYWRVIEDAYHPTAPGNRAVLCVPKKTKAAKETLAAFETVPRIPTPAELAVALGWNGHRPTDGRKVHWGTAVRLLLPTPRVFLHLPRQTGDGWTPPDFYTEVTEAEFMRAIEAHNALVPEDSE